MMIQYVVKCGNETYKTENPSEVKDIVLHKVKTENARFYGISGEKVKWTIWEGAERRFDNGFRYTIELRDEKWMYKKDPTTPGSQYFSINYPGSIDRKFREFRDIKFLFVRGHTLYATPFMETHTNNFSPSYDTTRSFNGCPRILPALEKLRVEGQLHSHRNSDNLSGDLIPSESA